MCPQEEESFQMYDEPSHTLVGGHKKTWVRYSYVLRKGLNWEKGGFINEMLKDHNASFRASGLGKFAVISSKGR